MADEAAPNLADLEKQVDDVLGQINEVLNLSKDAGARRGPEADDADVTGSGKDNLSDWKRKQSKHDQQPDMTSKAAPETDIAERLEKAAELLGLDSNYLATALVKSSAKLKKNSDDDDDDGNGDDDEDDDDDECDDSDPTKKAAPESVVIDGETISKASVPEPVFNLLKKQSERIEKSEKDLKKAQDDAEMERLRKRADDAYLHVPGNTQERADMLKAMTGMPKELRASFEKVFNQSEKLAKAAFQSLGVAGGRNPDEMQKTRRDFETKVSEIAKRDSCSRHEAMTKARHEDPEGFKAYQGNGN